MRSVTIFNRITSVATGYGSISSEWQWNLVFKRTTELYEKVGVLDNLVRAQYRDFKALIIHINLATSFKTGIMCSELGCL